VGNSLVVWAAPAISEIESGSKLGLSCAYRYTPVMEPVTYKGQRADGWMRDIAARESADSLRLTRETRYRFAVSQQKCDHLPLEKFDCLARALRFDLTRRRTRLLRRPLRVSFVVRGLGACPSSRAERLDPRKSLKIKATERNKQLWSSNARRRLWVQWTPPPRRLRVVRLLRQNPPQWRRYAHDNSIVILSRLLRACVISCVESKRMYLRSRSCKARRTRA
jgi:Uncharacterized protein conserved in bacteria (DUF2213)